MKENAIFEPKRREKVADTEIFYMEVDSIYRPSERFLLSKRELEKFQVSIKENGFLDPVTVTSWGELADGRKRLCAARCLDISHVPCVLDTSGYISTDKRLISEISRSSGDFFSDAAAISELITKHLLTQDAIACALGVSQSYVANKLRLLKLSPEERRIIDDENMSERHARAFLRLKDPYVRREAINHAVQHRLNVSATESYVDSLIVSSAPDAEDNTGSIRHACKAIDKAVTAAENLGIPVTLRRFDDSGCICYSIRLKR